MPSLQILTLGSPEIRLDNVRVAVKPKKALALLLYLATEQRVHSRDSLATLLWPDSSQRKARAALRRRLSELNAAIGETWLHSDGEQVSLESLPDLWNDVNYFEQKLSACRAHDHPPDDVCSVCLEPLESAAQIYRDDFLVGFSLPDCPEYDDWQFFQAESLRQQLDSVLERLVQLHSSQGNATAAIAYARRWITLDPLHEPAHRALMLLYHESDQRSAALRQYELCLNTLDVEMGVPPEPETTALYESIRTRQAAIVGGSVVNDPAPTPLHEPPAQADLPPNDVHDEVRMATVLALDVDAATEDDWDQRPDVTATRIADFLRVAPALLHRYEATLTHASDNGFQALFGLLALHEDDAERAIFAALQLQDAARAQDLSITAGISTGMVYVSHAQRNAESTVTGPTVNMASRLKGQSPFGHILLDTVTHYQTEQAFRFEPHQVALRGSEHTATVYEPLRARRHTVKSRGIGSLHAPLIGRDEELAILLAALRKARQGQGQLVTLIGEAGLGKSRLVAELKAAALNVIEEQEADSILWTEGRCLEMNRTVAYWPFIDILQTRFGWMRNTPETARASQVTSTLDELYQEQRLTAEQVDTMGPILGQLLSLHFANDWDQRLQHARPEQIRHQTFQTLRDFTAAHAQRQPLVIVLEDLHWADPLTLDLIGYLMETLAETPLLLLCVYRPESALKQDRLASVATRKCPAAYTEIRLRELAPGNSRALVEALLHVEGLSPATKKRILDTCQGNPFFLEEVVHDLIEADLIYHNGDVWQARRAIETTPVPTRVQSVILARVDRLTARDKQILQHAAVIGRLFSPQVLASSLTQDIDVDEALASLENSAFLYPEQTVPHVVYSFRHVLAQEAVYQTIPGQRCAALHADVGAALEQSYGDEVEEVVEQLAYHYDRSDAAEKAIEYLLRAGDKAARAYLTNEAVAHYQRAIQRIDEVEPSAKQPEWRFHALSELGKTYMRSSQYDDAETTLRQAIAWGSEQNMPVKQVARLHWWLGDLLMNWNPRYEETLQTGLDGLAMLGEEDAESAEAAMMYGIIAFGYSLQHDMQRFLEITSRLANFINCVPYSEEFRVSYGCIIHACWPQKDLEACTKWLGIAEERARRHHDDWALAEMMWVRSYALFFTGGDPEAALDAMRMSLSLCERVGDAKRRNWAEIGLAETMGDYGMSSQGEMHLRQALPSTYRINEEHVSDVLLKLASSCMAQRKWSETREALQESLQLMEKQHHNPAEAMILLGFTDLATGNIDLAIEHFTQALHALEHPDFQPQHWRKWDLMVNSFFANTLYGLECALDDADTFRAFCDEFRTQHPDSKQATFKQWYLEPAELSDLPASPTARDQFCSALSGEWVWCDPNGGCSYTVEQGLTVWSASARDLLFPLLNAPRVMRYVAGDFAAQVTCQPACADRPGIGGILLWQDKSNYLRLSIGVRAQDEMSLEGCINDKGVVIGRGRLVASPVTLRMERIGDTVRALCSADGEEWFTVGQAEFPVASEVQVGLHAIGFPDRTIYHAPYPDGTAIRFTDFHLWN